MNNQRGFAVHVVIIGLLVVALVAVSGLYVFKRNSSNKENSSLQTVKDNTDQSKSELTVEEKSKQAQTFDNTVSAPSVAETVETVGDGTQAKFATVDQYGPSTKLDRPNVHAAALSVGTIYSQYLYALQSAPSGARQEASNKFISDNPNYFSNEYFEANHVSTTSLSLLNLGANYTPLPASTLVGSAIMYPGDPTKVQVQVLLQPDEPMSVLVTVKTSDYLGNFGYIEKTEIRNTRDPL